jgi:hypothetical protein
MNHRFLGVLSLTCLFFTVAWLALLIAGLAGAGSLESFELVLAYVSRLNALFYLTYLNAALVTLSAAALFAGLYAFYRQSTPGWAEIGFAFVPVYATLNLVVYLSQVTVVPALLELRADAGMQAMAEFLLRQAIQQWPASGIAALNGMAYAILGVPSIIFGMQMLRAGKSLAVGGVMLVLNAVACLIGFAGAVMLNDLLSLGTLLGGVFFLLALIFISVGYWSMKA